MKIALINGSPKIHESASGCVLHELKALLDNTNHMICEYSFKKPQLSSEEMDNLAECNVLVFAFPLYVDGIPSHLLNCLVQLETLFSAIKETNILVYSVINCGFYEGRQNELAIEIMENWCIKAGLKWGQGIAIGAGGMLPMLKNVPNGHGLKKNLERALIHLSNNILKSTSGDNICITANFPRILYKLTAEMGWRQSIKANGLKRKDLFFKK